MTFNSTDTQGLSAYEIVATVAFVEWGIIHILAGVMTFLPLWRGQGVGAVYKALYGAMGEAQATEWGYDRAFPRWAERLVYQHGWNLLLIGIWSCMMPWVLAARARWAFMIGFAPVFFDWGYFLGIDLKELGGLMGEAQTYIVSTGAIMTALAVWDRHAANAGDPVTNTEFAVTLLLASLLIPSAIANKLSILACRGDPKRDGPSTKKIAVGVVAPAPIIQGSRVISIADEDVQSARSA